jgi:hypothetical protein
MEQIDSKTNVLLAKNGFTRQKRNTVSFGNLFWGFFTANEPVDEP